MKNTKVLLLAALLVVLAFAIAPVSAAGPKGDSVIDVARAVNAESGEFSTLLFALEATGLDEVLDARNGKVTVFAPTDAAFAALPPGVLDSLVADPEALANVLLYHVAPGNRYAADVIDSDQIRMFNGDFASVYFDGENVFLNGNAQVIMANVGAANGVIHVINNVLVP
jgi:uncharacterized surface protein with fasciclin (FAS1) repeats